MDESKPKTGEPEAPPEQSGDADAEDNSGDFTLTELMRAHARNFDHQGRLVDRPKGDD